MSSNGPTSFSKKISSQLQLISIQSPENIQQIDKKSFLFLAGVEANLQPASKHLEICFEGKLQQNSSQGIFPRNKTQANLQLTSLRALFEEVLAVI